jgi:hypothetical protein
VDSEFPSRRGERRRGARAHLEALGRDLQAFGVEARIPYGEGDPAAWSTLIAGWREAGATHIDLNTMRFGLETPEDHLRAFRRFIEAVPRM